MDSPMMRKREGFGLVEIVIAIGIITSALFASAVLVKMASQAIRQTTQSEQATFLAQEGIEVVRLLRDISWSSNIAPLAAGSTYYPVFNSGTQTWSLDTTNPGPIAGSFTRTVSVEDVYRKNADDDIVDASSPEPKTIDPGTKKIIVETSWGSSPVHTKEFITYVADIF